MKSVHTLEVKFDWQIAPLEALPLMMQSPSLTSLRVCEPVRDGHWSLQVWPTADLMVQPLSFIGMQLDKCRASSALKHQARHLLAKTTSHVELRCPCKRQTNLRAHFVHIQHLHLRVLANLEDTRIQLKLQRHRDTKTSLLASPDSILLDVTWSKFQHCCVWVAKIDTKRVRDLPAPHNHRCATVRQFVCFEVSLSWESVQSAQRCNSVHRPQRSGVTVCRYPRVPV